ncbi:hypothetical protein ADK38_20015 [Streptomyces varsoviensis]|uniref:Thioesterase TesA-like domain-containing protein n=1 Tax=Streptomyces varsoviensis TaxID=67373 RepID=A0ABR5J4S6_9ACTN|nr:hypothetical protein ADK38_20015 [Streptomyces varsoviensis]
MGLGVLLPLRSTGSRPPLFCVHPTLGLSWGYLGLLRHLSQDQPVYGLQARGLAGEERMPRSLQEMAEDYVEQIRAAQPEGPYHILGWSFGGTVAHTMAARLAETGERVALLAVLDAFPSAGVKVVDAGDEPPEGGRVSGADERVGEQVQRELDEFIEVSGVEDGQGTSTGLRSAVQRVHDNLVRAAAGYTPPSYPGDLLLFVAAEGRPAEQPVAESIASWQPYIEGDIESHEVAADHHRMLRSAPLSHIARVITRKLRSAAEA